MFSESSNPAGMPRFWVCTALYSVQKCPEVNGIVVQYWTIITGGMNCVLQSQSLAVSNLMYIVRNMQQCTLECGIWGESTHYTKRMQWNVITLSCYDFQLQTVKTSY